MIIEDITFSEKIEHLDLVKCEVPLTNLIPVQVQILKALKLFMEAYESKQWLHKATVNVLCHLYVREANVQLAKAKEVMKEKPNFKKRIKWLLKLK